MIRRVFVALTLSLVATDLAAQLPIGSECGVTIHARAGYGFAPIPQGDIFCPLIADPKETRSFVAYLDGADLDPVMEYS